MNDIAQFLVSHGGPVLFAIVFVEQAGLPLPAAPWLLTAGALSASRQLNPVFAIGVTVVAAMIADTVWFYIGRRGGQRVLRLFCRLSLARNSCVGRTRGLFARHGLQALIAAKFLPGLGTVMPPLAGALGMRTSRFLLFDGLGSLVYAAFYILTGLIFHNQLQQGMVLLKQLGSSVMLLLVIAIAAYVMFKYTRRRKALTAENSQRLDPGEPTVRPENIIQSNAGPIGFPVQSLNDIYSRNVTVALTPELSKAAMESRPVPVLSDSVCV
jgi:membrane protein DedA with SNARE-associated domain